MLRLVCSNLDCKKDKKKKNTVLTWGLNTEPRIMNELWISKDK